MQIIDKSYIVLLIKNAHTVFCYFDISTIDINNFEETYGHNTWNNSQPALKVYFIENGISKENETIKIDPFTDNWYINIPEDDKDIFVEIGRFLNENEYIPIAVSNRVTTPRDHISGDTNIYYIDVSLNSPALNISRCIKE